MVILGVTGGDQSAVCLMGGLPEKGIAGVATSFFDADLEFFTHAGDIGASSDNGDAEGVAEIRAFFQFVIGL